MQTVSVIVPNYNHALFLPRRLESILQQTVEVFEIIILDDASTDNSRDVINSFVKKDPRIRTIFNNTNSGNPFRQWKKGIENARGSMVWIAESDDDASTDFLERSLKALEKNPDAGIAYCQSHFIDREGEIIGNHALNLKHLHPTLWDNDFCLDGKELVRNYMPVMNIIPNASAVVFKKDLCSHVQWEEVLRFNLAGDRYFWVSLLMHTQLCFLSKSMNYFRMSEDSVREHFKHTRIYLDEMIRMMEIINHWAGLPVKVKKRAIKQWQRHLRQTIRHKKGAGKLIFFIQSIPRFFRLFRFLITR